MSIEIRPYFADGDRYPRIVGVRADGDEHETAYVCKAELAAALDENGRLREECENARLRGDDLAVSIEEWRAITEARGQAIDRLAAENAELRELARHIMHQCNDGNPRCDECVGWNGGECVALLRMRELGVEP